MLIAFSDDLDRYECLNTLISRSSFLASLLELSDLVAELSYISVDGPLLYFRNILRDILLPLLLLLQLIHLLLHVEDGDGVCQWSRLILILSVHDGERARYNLFAVGRLYHVIPTVHLPIVCIKLILSVDALTAGAQAGLHLYLLALAEVLALISRAT